MAPKSVVCGWGRNGERAGTFTLDYLNDFRTLFFFGEHPFSQRKTIPPRKNKTKRSRVQHVSKTIILNEYCHNIPQLIIMFHNFPSFSNQSSTNRGCITSPQRHNRWPRASSPSSRGFGAPSWLRIQPAIPVATVHPEKPPVVYNNG